MRIITHDDGRCLTLRLLGELDHAAAQEVMPGIEDAVEEYLPRRCVLDLSGLSFMDSSGIAVILKNERLLRQTGGALALCGVWRCTVRRAAAGAPGAGRGRPDQHRPGARGPGKGV